MSTQKAQAYKNLSNRKMTMVQRALAGPLIVYAPVRDATTTLSLSSQYTRTKAPRMDTKKRKTRLAMSQKPISYPTKVSTVTLATRHPAAGKLSTAN